MTWVDERFGCVRPDGRRHVCFGVRVLHARSYGYRPDLARYPHDPEAVVDGPRALQKLIDTRQARDGWVPSGRSMDDLEREIPSSDIPEVPAGMFQEALAEARNAPPETPKERQEKEIMLNHLRSHRS